MRKTLSAAAVLAVAALSVAACGKNNNTTAGYNDTTADTAATLPPADTNMTAATTDLNATTNATVNATTNGVDANATVNTTNTTTNAAP